MSAYKSSSKRQKMKKNIPVYISASSLNDIQGEKDFNSTENMDKWSAGWYQSAVTEERSTSDCCSRSMADDHG